MFTGFHLDARGVREVLHSEGVRELVDAAAEDVLARLQGLLGAGVDIQVRRYTTDRSVASIVVADVRAMAWQARDGILTRAAGAAGLEVREWQR